MNKPAGWDAMQKKDYLSPSEIKVAAEIIKERVSVPDVIAMYAPNPAPRHNRIPCPIHHGEDYNLSFQSKRFKCHVCGAGGDCIDFVKALYGLKFAETVRKINADFHLGLDNQDTADVQYAAKAAAAYREEREAQRRKAVDDFHRWNDLLLTYDQWLAVFPAGDPRHDEAARELVRIEYKRNCAEQRLKQFE